MELKMREMVDKKMKDQKGETNEMKDQKGETDEK